MKIKYLFLIISLFLLGELTAQCNAASFTVTTNAGTCFSNASIDVQVPGASTCAGWTAILTRPDLTQTSLAIPANGGPVSFNSLPAGN